MLPQPLSRAEKIKVQKNRLRVMVTLLSFSLLIILISYETNLRHSQQVIVTENWGAAPFDQGRQVANQSEYRGLNWEQQLAKNLPKQIDRESASVSSRPEDLSQLSFGQLSGNYRIVTEPDLGGQVWVQELEYVASTESVSQPVYVGDVTEFLSKNRHLFGLDQTKIKLLSSLNDAAIVTAVRPNGSAIKIELKRDQKKRLIRLSVANQN